jgi:hypothetical protein
MISLIGFILHSHKVATPHAVLKAYAYELLILSYERRLYHLLTNVSSHPFPLPKLARYENNSLVVERFPIKDFAADCPFINT